MGIGIYTPESIAMPAKGGSVTDLNFHATITRITDRTIDAYSESSTEKGIENEYSRSDPENCDGTRLILRSNDGNWYLYNAQTFQMIKQVNITGGGEEPEPRWYPNDPNRFYYLYGTELRSYDISDDSNPTIHDFTGVATGAAYISTKTEGDASLDRRYWCFMVEDSAFNVLKVICYDKNSNTILGTFEGSSLPAGLGINWTSMSMLGNYCIIGYQDDGIGYASTEVFTKAMAHVSMLPQGVNGHMDLALDGSGNDIMVYQNNATDWIAMADLQTGAETNLVEIPFSVNGDIGLHFSGNCSAEPGWVLVSTYGSKNPPSGEAHSWMDNQIYMVELKASPRIWRIAHTHAYTSLDYTGDKNYFAEAFAAINTKGTRVYFGSNWDNFTILGYSESYKVTFPADWQNSMP